IIAFHKNIMQTGELTFAKIASKFQVSLRQASEEFSITLPIFKRICRTHGIKNWPYRKVRITKVHSLNEKLTVLLCKIPEEERKTKLHRILKYLQASAENVDAFTSMHSIIVLTFK